MNPFKRSFWENHWRKVLGGALAVAGVFVPALLPLAPLGTLILGSDFQVGSKVGTAIGAGAKKVVNHESLSAEELQALADAAQSATEKP